MATAPIVEEDTDKETSAANRDLNVRALDGSSWKHLSSRRKGIQLERADYAVEYFRRAGPHLNDEGRKVGSSNMWLTEVGGHKRGSRKSARLVP